jgi:hypothetical protein
MTRILSRACGPVGLAMALLGVAGCSPNFDDLLPPGDGGGIGACTEPSDCPDPGACGDVLCEDGFCLFQARQCDDGNPCTLDFCVADTDECATAPDSDKVGEECEPNRACTAAGECECLEGFQDCDDEPGCESHANSDPQNCGSCGNGCTSGMACIGGECGTCDNNEQCDDGRVCTVGTCDVGSGECSQDVVAHMCLISGTCRDEFTADPNNPCRECDPDVDPYGWTPRTGASCDDGNFCTSDTSCDSAAECAGGVPTCDDGLECTANQCRKDPDQCIHPLRDGWCLIDGVCYPDGEQNPENECQLCDAAVNPASWSPVQDGTACGGDDADLQCVSGVCGGCASEQDCVDGDPCTVGTCQDDRRCAFEDVDQCCGPGQCWGGDLIGCCTEGAIGCVCGEVDQ